MNSDLVFDIKKTATAFNMNKVKIFLNKNCPVYSLCSAVALKTYLIEMLNIDTTIVVTQDTLQQIPESFSDLIYDIDFEGPDLIIENQNDFISVILDCTELFEIENDAYFKTYLLFEVNGGTDARSYGIKTYNSKDALCSAEIIYSSIMAHSLAINQIHLRSLGFIYMALLDITSNFHSHMKPETFLILQELSDLDIDTEYYAYIYERKDLQDLRILQAVYTKTKIENKVAYTIFNKESELYKIPTKNFKNCLEYLRYIDSVDIWIIFIENEDGQYTVLLQGSTYGNCDVSRIALKYNGSGTRKRASFKIINENLSDVIKDAKTTIRNTNKFLIENF